MLPDEVLLEIFDFYVRLSWHEASWKTLVHVCRRWRYIVFGSPRRLNLRLLCTEGTPAREMLDIWPSLPIEIRGFDDEDLGDEMEDNIVAALEENNRVTRIFVEVLSDRQFEILTESMEVPFPALTHLDLRSFAGGTQIIPDSFLDGSAPCLQSLDLEDVAFPALPRLLLSATGLVHLSLLDIPRAGYVSSEAMVECLSSLTALKILYLEFQTHRPRPSPASRRPPSLTRTVLPVLTDLSYKGVNEYFHHTFSHIDVPQLEYADIAFFNAAILDIPQFAPFLRRSATFEAFDHAHMVVDNNHLHISFSSQAGTTGGKGLKLSIECNDSVWLLWSLTPFGYNPFDRIKPSSPPRWGECTQNYQWLQLLRFFPAVKDLCISEQVALWVAPALEELCGEQVTEVLPALENLFIEKLVPPVEEATTKFVAARHLSGHPVAVHCWPGEAGGCAWGGG
jgi:F-box-like